MEKRYQVFVSSTYADLKAERQKVVQALMEMDCIPAGMELFPAADEEQWEFIKRVIDDCDYYVLIIGGRYGSLTGDGISFTEKEYDYALSRGIKVLAFLHEKPEEIPVGKSDIDPTLRAKLEQFREKARTGKLVKFWSVPAELPGMVALSLAKTIKIWPSLGWIRGNASSNTELLNDLNDLRKENSRLTSLTQTLKDNAPDGLELAGFDELFEVSFEGHEYFAGSRRNATHKKEISWGDIFSLLAPELQECPADSIVKNRLKDLLVKKFGLSLSSPEISTYDYQTIQIQLKALGLVTIDYLKTVGGSMNLFWQLTPKGSETMVRLRAIKAKGKS